MSTPPLRLDANLLIALDALLRERNVTRAAAAVGIGQPGMSHALQRLREHFRDPLLVRQGNRFRLSPRATQWAAPVQETVAAMRRVFAQQDTFDPARARHTFRIAMTDGVGQVVLPELLRRLAAAPHVSLEVYGMPEGALAADLAAGALDLAVTHFGELPATVRRELLWLEDYVALVPRRFKLTAGRKSRADHAKARHVFVNPRPGRPAKLVTMLRERGLDPRTVLTVPHFLLLPGLVAESGVVATVARSLARRFEATHAVRAAQLPFALPSYEISQVWHERSDVDPAHRWLRGVLADAARAATAGVKPRTAGRRGR